MTTCLTEALRLISTVISKITTIDDSRLITDQVVISINLGQQHSEEALCWDLRIYIALDVARAIEYLHDGVSNK